MSSNIKIEASWKEALSDQFEQPYFQSLAQYIRKRKAEGAVIYPPGPKIFNAFNKTPFHEVKVVILGQDPYHNPGQAMGLCFSVPKDVTPPPSLKRIYQELNNDLGIEPPDHGDLSAWAENGVFLLNAILTVEKNKPGAHKDIGWQDFTDAAIRKLSNERDHLVFMLWGNFAKRKKALVDTDKHLVLTSAHPSPFTRDAFFNNHHFSQANEFLKKHNMEPVDWRLEG